MLLGQTARPVLSPCLLSTKGAIGGVPVTTRLLHSPVSRQDKTPKNVFTLVRLRDILHAKILIQAKKNAVAGAEKTDGDEAMSSNTCLVNTAVCVFHSPPFSMPRTVSG